MAAVASCSTSRTEPGIHSARPRAVCITTRAEAAPIVPDNSRSTNS
jgi:hypothetical protein